MNYMLMSGHTTTFLKDFSFIDPNPSYTTTKYNRIILKKFAPTYQIMLANTTLVSLNPW